MCDSTILPLFLAMHIAFFYYMLWRSWNSNTKFDLIIYFLFLSVLVCLVSVFSPEAIIPDCKLPRQIFSTTNLIPGLYFINSTSSGFCVSLSVSFPLTKLLVGDGFGWQMWCCRLYGRVTEIGLYFVMKCSTCSTESLCLWFFILFIFLRETGLLWYYYFRDESRLSLWRRVLAMYAFLPLWIILISS